MKNSKATPRPWSLGEYGGINGSGIAIDWDNGLSGMANAGVMVAQIPNKNETSLANAELIVRAVNSHDELIETLKQAWACIEHIKDQPYLEAAIETMKEIEQVLNKVTGE